MKSLRGIIVGLIVIFIGCFCNNISAFENLFYTLRYGSLSGTGLTDLLKKLDDHAKSIQVLASQSYVIKPNGVLAEKYNPQLLQFAKDHHIRFLALVSNPVDEEHLAHQFLQNETAQQKAIQSLLTACLDHHLDGVQLDFENISVTDRHELTRFYQKLANALHQHHLLVSIAIVPRISDKAGNSAYELARFTHWSGAYDYKALGESSDFVTLMAYDQHEGKTTPGPIATIHWAEAIIHYGLKYIPAQKISLGIPTYSGFWKTIRTSGGVENVGMQIPYDTVEKLKKKFNPTLHWDSKEKIYYTFYEHNELNEYLFIEDAHSFAAKYALAKKYHLRGVSVWRLCIEDPKIWSVVKP